MTQLTPSTHIVDPAARQRTADRFHEKGILLPTFAQLADPSTIPPHVRVALGSIDPDAPHPLNLFRVHWHNDAGRRAQTSVPDHLVLPPSLTGVPARIVVALGDRFPMIHAHKVLAAYGCLVPRVVTGTFDPTRHRALWPSTGNYCRGGVAISRIMDCRGVAILPAGMSEERFRWLEQWVGDPADIIRTPGTESNVKEIYDACNELSKDPDNVVLNQFSEFGNYLAHWCVTGRAMERIVRSMQGAEPNLKVAAFVSASGSAGTLGAGDYLKDVLGARVVAAEALECPTLLYNGFGEHNIQGIGDKHVPLIHNVLATDGAQMYGTERQKAVRKYFGGTFDPAAAAESFGAHLAGASTDHLLELTERDRDRIFNLGYYTWVEQQGVTLEAFEARRSQAFWKQLREMVPVWDEMISEFNRQARVEAAT